jgi:hypothetical protein
MDVAIVQLVTSHHIGIGASGRFHNCSRFRSARDLSSQSVSVGRRLLRSPQAFVGEPIDHRRELESALIFPQKNLGFLFGDGRLFRCQVQCIDKQDDFNGLIHFVGGLIVGSKRNQLLRLPVVEQSEVFGFESWYRASGFVVTVTSSRTRPSLESGSVLTALGAEAAAERWLEQAAIRTRERNEYARIRNECTMLHLSAKLRVQNTRTICLLPRYVNTQT